MQKFKYCTVLNATGEIVNVTRRTYTEKPQNSSGTFRRCRRNVGHGLIGTMFRGFVVCEIHLNPSARVDVGFYKNSLQCVTSFWFLLMTVISGFHNSCRYCVGYLYNINIRSIFIALYITKNVKCSYLLQ